MADEIRVTREDETLAAGTHQHGREIRSEADVEAVIPPDRTAHVEPVVNTTDDPDAVRAEIQQTRARMSETIDEIEDAIIRKKEQIQDRLDFLAPVRERPLAALGAVFGAGLLLGLLTGGDDDEDDYDSDYDSDRFDRSHDRAEMWERRARRLLRIAREQEEEIEALTSGRAAPLRGRREVDEWDEEEPVAHSRGLRDSIAERVGDFFTDAIRQLFVPGPRLG